VKTNFYALFCVSSAHVKTDTNVYVEKALTSTKPWFLPQKITKQKRSIWFSVLLTLTMEWVMWISNGDHRLWQDTQFCRLATQLNGKEYGRAWPPASLRLESSVCFHVEWPVGQRKYTANYREGKKETRLEPVAQSVSREWHSGRIESWNYC
jgi:hypothetical protein